MAVGSSDSWPVTMCRLRPREWNCFTQGHSGYYWLKEDLLHPSPELLLLYHEAINLWVSSLEILGWDHSTSRSQSWPIGLPLCSSQPDPLFLSSCVLAICSPTLKFRKEEEIWVTHGKFYCWPNQSQPLPALFHLEINFLWPVICQICTTLEVPWLSAVLLGHHASVRIGNLLLCLKIIFQGVCNINLSYLALN